MRWPSPARCGSLPGSCQPPLPCRPSSWQPREPPPRPPLHPRRGLRLQVIEPLVKELSKLIQMPSMLHPHLGQPANRIVMRQRRQADSAAVLVPLSLRESSRESCTSGHHTPRVYRTCHRIDPVAVRRTAVESCAPAAWRRPPGQQEHCHSPARYTQDTGGLHLRRARPRSV